MAKDWEEWVGAHPHPQENPLFWFSFELQTEEFQEMLKYMYYQVR